MCQAGIFLKRSVAWENFKLVSLQSCAVKAVMLVDGRAAGQGWDAGAKLRGNLV